MNVESTKDESEIEKSKKQSPMSDLSDFEFFVPKIVNSVELRKKVGIGEL